MLKEIDEHTNIVRSIDRLVLNASLAANRLEVMDQAQVDKAVAALARAAHAARGMLAAMAVEETGRGNYRDKVAKNDFAARNVYDYIKDDKTVGIINDDPVSGVMKVAEPVGIIAGVTPLRIQHQPLFSTPCWHSKHVIPSSLVSILLLKRLVSKLVVLSVTQQWQLVHLKIGFNGLKHLV